jgi:tryptophan synthase alpha chain
MKRIATVFASLSQRKRTALIPFVTAGDPAPAHTVPLMHALVKAGADVIELGVPFSDPMADGPVIQRSSERALSKGVHLRQILAWVREFRLTDTNTPVVLMGYANPIEAMGVDAFVADAAGSGVDGVLVVDYPPEESDEWAAKLGAAGLAPIFLLAPTTPAVRIAHVARLAKGYVYYVSLRGVTGAGHLDTADVAEKLDTIRQHVKIPVGVGFGIRDGATARAVAQHADAVVIGSALVQAMEAVPNDPVHAAYAWLSNIRTALDQPA